MSYEWLLDSAKHDPVEDYYTFGKKMGAGSFSTVFVGVSKEDSRTRVALKVIDKAAVKDKTSMLVAEVDILRSIQHDNVIGLLDMFETPTQVILVMELVTGGELFERIVVQSCLSEAESASAVRQLLAALEYLHHRSIVHRDLKPENLLFASPDPHATLKIADFGLSTVLKDDGVLMTACGTPGYVAPEVLKAEGYSSKADLWSVGVILYILLCGFPPFYDENLNILFEQIMAGGFDYPSPYWDHISDGAKDLINRLLVVDPHRRLTASEALNHPWLAHETVHPPPTQQQDNEIVDLETEFKRAVLARLAIHKFSTAVVLVPE